uniref:Uncharacterized protein n=1 Tax=Anopheles culicifacies TaxID=139723 RepID=A0A182MDV0_9DIPT
MLLGGLYYTTSGAGGTNAIVTSVGGTGIGGGWAGSSTSVASMLNNNSPKMSNKNAPLTKSMSLQSMASLSGSMNHLAGAANGQAANAHSESDLKEAGVDKEDSLGGDLLTPSSGALSSSATTTTTAGSGASLAQTLATSSTQAVSVPVTSPLMQYSAVATSNHQAASMQAHLQAAQHAHAAAQHAHAVHAQAAANQNAVLAAAAAAATAQYPSAASAHYADAASMAKEVAHKNYALKLHGGSTALTGKPLTALGYTGVTLNKGGLLPQPGQQYAAAAAAAAAASATNAATAAYPQTAARLSTPTVAVAAATPQQTLLAPSLTTRPPPPIMSQPGAYPQFLRPPMPAAFGSNPYAAAAVAQQQLMNQSFMYPGAAFSAAAAAAAAAATGGYQFPMAQAGIPSNLTAIPTPVPQVSATPAAGSAVVLNPYKKMKTS